MAILLLSMSMANQGPGRMSSRIRALKMMLMVSSGYQRSLGLSFEAQCSQGIVGQSHQYESHLFDCVNPYSCNFYRAMTHRMALMKVKTSVLMCFGKQF